MSTPNRVTPAALPVVVAITGASGAVLGTRVVRHLATIRGVAVHLIVTTAGRRILLHEAGKGALTELEEYVAVVHDVGDIGACIASGSYPTGGMIVAPCSIRTLSAIAYGIADDLVVRAADVHLKERRRLVLAVRETPLHLGHLRAMTAVTETGAIVMPPVPAFYHEARSLDTVVDNFAARAIDLLRLPGGACASPWTGNTQPPE